MIELGQPEQLPFNSTVTTPFLKDLKVMSPPSLATAGLTLVSRTSLIFFTTSSESSDCKFFTFLSLAFFTTTSFP